MTKFQKQFVLKCLNEIQKILKDEDLLEKAVLIFNQVPLEADPRKFPEKFTDGKDWTTAEKAALSAAMLQGITFTTFEYASVCVNDQLIELTNLFLDKYIPLITAETEQRNRIESVISNIDKTKVEVSNEPITPVKKPGNNSVEHNPFLFFAGVIGVLGVVGGVAYAFSNPKNP